MFKKHHSLSIILLFLFIFSSNAQTDLSVKVMDAETKEELTFANVYLKHNQLGNSTNLKGEITLNLQRGYISVDTLTCSYIGYRDTAIIINLPQKEVLQVHLTPQRIMLQEITVKATSSKLTANKIVKKALKSTKKNYATKETVLSGFYRELVSENKKYVQLNEAFFDLYYTAYPQKRYTKKGWRAYYETYPSADYYPSRNSTMFSTAQFFKYYNTTKDQCRIIASRASEDWSEDEIELTPLNGPLDLSAADKVKYQADFLDPKLFNKYTYKKTGATNINGEPCFIITFKPKKLKITRSQDLGKKVKIPIYSGAMYISINSFAIVKFECQLTEGAITPSRYRGNIPKNLSLVCEYKKERDKWYLNKVINKQSLILGKENEIKYTKTISRELNVQNVETQKAIPFPYDFETTFIDKRTGNLRHFPTRYDSIFWAETKNYIPLDIHIQNDLEEIATLDFQFKDRFLKKDLKIPVPSIFIDSLIKHTNNGFNRQEINKLKDKNLYTYIQSENEYFNNYFIPQKSDFAQARQTTISKTKFCNQTQTKPKIEIKNGYSDLGKFGIILKKENSRKLLVNFEKEICKNCYSFNYQFNQDSTVFSYLVINPIKPNHPVLHIKDVVNNKTLSEINNLSEFFWLNNKTLLYQTIDESLRSYQLHAYSTISGKSNLLYETKTKEEEIEYCYTTKDKNKIFFLLTNGDFNQVLFVNQKSELKEIYDTSENIYSTEINEDENDLYLLVRDENWKSTILKKEKLNPSISNNWNTVLTESNNELIDDFSLSPNFIIIKTIKEGITQLFYYNKSDLSNRKEIKFPTSHHSIYISNSKKLGKDTIAVGYSSLDTPPGEYIIDLASGEMTFKAIRCHNLRRKQVATKYKTNIMKAPSLDNKEEILIRLSQSANPNIKKKGIILKVYGAYGAFSEQNYDEFEAFFMDKGYIIAQAHVRGSRTKGWEWYADGKALNKKNSIDDFIASAKYLKNHKNTKNKPIIAYGQSAGGVVIGAAINQEPQLFKGGIFDYAYLDVLNSMQNEDLPLTTLEYQEWGNPNHQTDSIYIESYSPYQNITPQPYPHLLFFAGTKDFQTPYEQILKTVWRYRENNSSETDIIIHLGKNGHPGSIPYSQRSKEMIYQYLFVEKIITE